MAASATPASTMSSGTCARCRSPASRPSAPTSSSATSPSGCWGCRNRIEAALLHHRRVAVELGGGERAAVEEAGDLVLGLILAEQLGGVLLGAVLRHVAQ